MKQKWSNQELEEQYTILPEELALLKDIREKTTPPFAILITFYRNEKRFPKSMSEIPKPLSEYICTQLGYSKKENLIYEYDLESKTASRHRSIIREFFSFREPTLEDEKLFENWLIQEKLNLDHRYEYLEEIGIEWFHKRKIELPTEKQFERSIRSSIKTWESQLFNNIFICLDENFKIEVDTFLNISEEKTIEIKRSGTIKKKQIKNGFALIKDDPGKVGLESVMNEVEKLDLINKITIDSELLKNYLKKYLKGISTE